MTARMVAVRCAMNAEMAGWVTMLRSCGAFEAFMRAKGDINDTPAIIEFLLRDPQFPRSILSSASSALGSVQALTVNEENLGEEDDPRFALGRMCAEIEFASIATVHDNLMDEVLLLQKGVYFINTTMMGTFFHPTTAIEWRQ